MDAVSENDRACMHCTEEAGARGYAKEWDQRGCDVKSNCRAKVRDKRDDQKGL